MADSGDDAALVCFRRNVMMALRVRRYPREVTIVAR